MTNKELEDKTSIYFRMKFNEFNQAIWLESSISESQRSCMLDKMRQIEGILTNGCYE